MSTKAAEKKESDSSLCVSRHRRRGSGPRMGYRKFWFRVWKNCFMCQWLDMETACPGWLWNFHPLRYLTGDDMALSDLI